MKYIRIISVLLVICLVIAVIPLSAGAATKEEAESFIETISPLAIKDMVNTGILASLTIAQAIQESGFGKSTMAVNANNLFGIKAYDTWKGRVYRRISGGGFQLYSSLAEAKSIIGENQYLIDKENFFRAYDSWQESLTDHSTLLLTNNRYENIRGLTDYVLAAEYIQEDGYCTDEGYSETIVSLIERYNLDENDKIAMGSKIETLDPGVEGLRLTVGESKTIYPVVTPSSSVSAYLEYSSSDESVAVAEKGVIQGLKAGCAVITVKSLSGITESFTVYVVSKGKHLYSAVSTCDVNCRKEPSGDGGNSTVIDAFYKNTDLVIFEEFSTNGWSYVAGYKKSVLISGYCAAKYMNISGEYYGDTPTEPTSDESSAEESSHIEESSSPEESSAEESEEPSSEEPSSEEPSSESPTSEPFPEYDGLGDMRIAVTTGRLNCRAAGNVSGKWLGSFLPDVTLLVLGDATSTGWYHVVGIGEGGKVLSGFCGNTYLSFTDEFVSLPSEFGKIDEEMITDFPVNATVKALAETQKYASVTVTKDGRVLGESEKITDGCVVSFSWCGEVYFMPTVKLGKSSLPEEPSEESSEEISESPEDEYEKGDVDGDGEITVMDYVALRLYILRVRDLSEKSIKAACITGSAEPCVADYIMLRLTLLNTQL